MPESATPKMLLDALEQQAGRIIGDGDEHSPMLFCLQCHNDGKSYFVAKISAVQMPEPELREQMAAQLSEIVEQYDGYIFITEAWIVKIRPNVEWSPEEAMYHAEHMQPRPSQHPDRVEVLQVHFVSKLGEQLNRTYEILRPENKRPSLKLDNESDKPMAGIFANLYEYTLPQMEVADGAYRVKGPHERGH